MVNQVKLQNVAARRMNAGVGEEKIWVPPAIGGTIFLGFYKSVQQDEIDDPAVCHYGV